MEQEYINLRNTYLPETLKAVFVLESPPQGRGYFYDPEGRVSEVLFRAFMKLIGCVPRTKDEGLKEFARRGYLVVDPVYVPVNKVSDKKADAIILDNYANFLKDLNALISNDKKLPIILVKSNILRLLEKPMLADGYNVINQGLSIPFPLHYHAHTFEERIQAIFPL